MANLWGFIPFCIAVLLTYFLFLHLLLWCVMHSLSSLIISFKTVKWLCFVPFSPVWNIILIICFPSEQAFLCTLLFFSPVFQISVSVCFYVCVCVYVGASIFVWTSLIFRPPTCASPQPLRFNGAFEKVKTKIWGRYFDLLLFLVNGLGPGFLYGCNKQDGHTATFSGLKIR